MLDFIKGLMGLNVALATKARALIAYDEGRALLDAKDYGKAFPLIRESAELGYPNSMALLGSMYLQGQGVKEDGLQAIRWLEQARNAGVESAASLLGMAYATGKTGVAQDIAKAREILTAEAQKGCEQSARMLGMMDRGEGIFAKHKKRGRRN